MHVLSNQVASIVSYTEPQLSYLDRALSILNTLQKAKISEQVNL